MQARMLWEWSREWCHSGVGDWQSSAEGRRLWICPLLGLFWIILVHLFTLTVEYKGKSLLFLICKVRNASISVMSGCMSHIKH